MFRAAECDTDLVVEKFRERLVVCKQTTHRFNMERLDLRS
jgi:hypothetical protein